jgi:hypothetical protein
MNWKLVVLSSKEYCKLKLQLESLGSISHQGPITESKGILIVQKIRINGERELLFSPNSIESISALLPSLGRLNSIDINVSDISDITTKSGFHLVFGSRTQFDSFFTYHDSTGISLAGKSLRLR